MPETTAVLVPLMPWFRSNSLALRMPEAADSVSCLSRFLRQIPQQPRIGAQVNEFDAIDGVLHFTRTNRLGIIDMSMKRAVLAAYLALSVPSAFSGDIQPMHGFEGSLGRKPYAVDIMRLSCGIMEGVTVDHASVSISDQYDFAKPRLKVMIAEWNGHACVNWSQPAGDPRDDDGLPSAERVISMPAVGGKYCLMVFKAPDNQDGPNPGTGPKTAVGAEEYLLDTHCAQEGISEHPGSTLEVFFVDM